MFKGLAAEPYAPFYVSVNLERIVTLTRSDLPDPGLHLVACNSGTPSAQCEKLVGKQETRKWNLEGLTPRYLWRGWQGRSRAGFLAPQNLHQFSVCDNHIRVALHGFEIMTGEPLADFRWHQQDAGLFYCGIHARNG